MSLEELREQRGKRIHQRSVTTESRAHLWGEEGEEEGVLPGPRSWWSVERLTGTGQGLHVRRRAASVLEPSFTSLLMTVFKRLGISFVLPCDVNVNPHL